MVVVVVNRFIPCDSNTQDALIEDLQRQITELTKCLEAQYSRDRDLSITILIQCRSKIHIIIVQCSGSIVIEISVMET